MMTILNEVRALIERLAGEPICDDCVAEKLGLAWASQANIATRELTAMRGFERQIGVCSLCGSDRKVTRRVRR